MSERAWEAVELGHHNEDLHTTRKSKAAQSDGRASGAVRYEVIQRCLRDGVLFVSVRCACSSFNGEAQKRTHAGKARVAKET